MSRRGIQSSRKVNDPFSATSISGAAASEESKVVEGADPFSYKEEVEPKSQPKPTEEAKEETKVEVKEEEKKVVKYDPFSDKEDLEPKPNTNKVVAPATPPIEEKKEEKEDLNKETTDSKDDEVNPYYHLGNALSKDGFLEGEVEKDVSGYEILNKYKESIKEQAVSEVRQQAVKELKEAGYNEEHLRYAKLISSGIDISSLQDSSRYNSLSSIKIEGSEETVKKNLITEYYKDREWESQEIEDTLDRISLDEKLDEVATKAKEYFSTKHRDLIKSQEKQAETAELNRKANAENQVKAVNDLITKGKLLNEELPDKKEFRSSIYNQSHVAEIDGKEYPVSELQSFLLEFQNDPETKLWAFYKWKYREEEKTRTKKEAKQEAEEDLLEGYKQVVQKNKSETTTRKVKEALRSQEKSDWVSPTGNRGPIIIGK